MEYKLLRMLMVFLQIGLIILVVLLISLVVYSYRSGNKYSGECDTKEPAIKVTDVRGRMAKVLQQQQAAYHLQAFEKTLTEASRHKEGHKQLAALNRVNKGLYRKA